MTFLKKRIIDDGLAKRKFVTSDVAGKLFAGKAKLLWESIQYWEQYPSKLNVNIVKQWITGENQRKKVVFVRKMRRKNNKSLLFSQVILKNYKGRKEIHITKTYHIGLSPSYGGNQNAISGWEHLWQQYKERKILGNDSLLTKAIYQLQLLEFL